MGNRPLIAVTPNYDYSIETATIKNLYTEAVHEAGGASVVLPCCTDEEVLGRVLDACSGLLVTVGPDIDARYFGENNLSFTGNVSPYRDAMEMFLIRQAARQKKPILGICRGLQILNVAFGGTLYQDIKHQIRDREIGEHSQKAPRWYPYHDIYIKRDSLVYKSFENRDRASVNSFHHQSVKDPAPGFLITSQAADGIIESIENTGYEFAVGVQWHPEDMWEKDRLYLNIFRMFVESCMKGV